jgi:hypothetical protein
LLLRVEIFFSPLFSATDRACCPIEAMRHSASLGRHRRRPPHLRCLYAGAATCEFRRLERRRRYGPDRVQHPQPGPRMHALRIPASAPSRPTGTTSGPRSSRPTRPSRPAPSPRSAPARCSGRIRPRRRRWAVRQAAPRLEGAVGRDSSRQRLAESRQARRRQLRRPLRIPVPRARAEVLTARLWRHGPQLDGCFLAFDLARCQPRPLNSHEPPPPNNLLARPADAAKHVRHGLGLAKRSMSELGCLRQCPVP